MSLSVRHVILIILGFVFILYCLFQARFLILGPSISIKSHKDATTLYDSQITLSGTARNAAWISLNDRQIFTDEKGLWSEKLILAKGLSIMTLRVRDRFGRERMSSVHLVLN